MPTIARPLQLSIGLWILAAVLTLLAATINGPLGGFSWVDLVARIACLVAAVQSLAAILQAANSHDAGHALDSAATELRAPTGTSS